jgi:hypothetical protein
MFVFGREGRRTYYRKKAGQGIRRFISGFYNRSLEPEISPEK